MEGLSGRRKLFDVFAGLGQPVEEFGEWPIELKLVTGLCFQFGDCIGGLVLSFEAFENACPGRLDRVGREIDNCAA